VADRFPAFAASTFFLLCVLLGGASAAGAAANGLLQAVGVVLILVCLWRMRDTPLAPEARALVWIVGLFVLVALLSLVPLPRGLWEALPGRGYIAHGFRLLGVPPGPLPLSLNAQGTIASLLSIIVPVAMFLLVVQLKEEDRRNLVWAVLAAAVASIMLGVFQLLGGEGSGLRFYRVTNVNAPVGFFANTNHLATLVLCALPFVGFLAARTASRSSGRAKRSGGLVMSGGIAAFLAVGVAVIGSLAGYGLFLPAAIASLLIYRRVVSGPLGARWLAALGGVFLLFVVLATAGPLTEQALSRKMTSQSTRKVIAERTTEAVKDYFPAGSGLGTFQDIYRLYDDPNRADREYVNHAHNDYLEWLLEMGAAGLLLALAFLAWWVRRTLAVWRADFRGANLARAASVTVGVVLLHSIVDYPLRTAAIAALVALSCALLVPYAAPRRGSEQEDGGPATDLRHLKAD
jgi:O-antigen ligase